MQRTQDTVSLIRMLMSKVSQGMKGDEKETGEIGGLRG